MRAGRGPLSRERRAVLDRGGAGAGGRPRRRSASPFDDELGLEGGHSRRRVVHADGAATGERDRPRARRARARASPHPRRRGRARASSSCRGRALRGCRHRPAGARGPRDAARDRRLRARCGSGRRIRPARVGDGIVLAYRAGAALADLEFVQFHPTVLAGNGLLLSRGAARRGCAAASTSDGERFTDELAPRDVVARAIDARGTALLDLRRDRPRPLPDADERARATQGFDPAREPIPVSPAAHYTMGGIVTDLDGRTDVPGLYAAGECACTGVHGANRLASNSLLECLVFGRRAALAALARRPRGHDTGLSPGSPRQTLRRRRDARAPRGDVAGRRA